MAVKSIIDVDVNDEKFKKFVEDFNKYQSALKKTGGSWDKVSRDLAKMSANGEDVSKHLKDHEERLKRQKKVYDDIKKSVKEISSEIKTVSLNIFNTTRSLLSWVGIGGIFTGLLGAGGLFGLDRLAQSIGDARRSAQGLGVTSGQQQAFGLNFGRYVDPGQNLNAIAEAKANYANRWAFSAMGVDPTGKDPAQLAVEMAQRAKQIFDRGDQSEQYAQAHGLLQFYTMDELRRLHATSAADLRASVAGYGRDVGQLSLQDQVQKKWQDFAIQMDRANLKIKNVLVDGLAPLAGPLNKLSSAVADALTTFLKSDALKELIPQLADGVKRFADYLSDGKFQSDMKTFITDFGLVVDAIVRGLKFLGVIPEGAPTPTTPGTTETAADTKAYKKPGSFFGFTTTGAKEKAAIAYFKAQGWTTAQATGIVANLERESSLDPNKFGDNGKAWGLAQWHDDRVAAMQKWMGGKDPFLHATTADQLAFVQYELTKGAERRAGDALKAAKTAAEAAAIVSKQYERPKDASGEAARRAALANKIEVRVNNNTGGNANVQANQARAF